MKNRYRNLGNSIKKSWDECSIKSRNELIKEKRDKSLKEFLRIIPVSISKEKPLNIPEECHYKPGRDLLANYDGILEGIAEEIPEKPKLECVLEKILQEILGGTPYGYYH